MKLPKVGEEEKRPIFLARPIGVNLNFIISTSGEASFPFPVWTALKNWPCVASRTPIKDHSRTWCKWHSRAFFDWLKMSLFAGSARNRVRQEWVEELSHERNRTSYQITHVMGKKWPREKRFSLDFLHLFSSSTLGSLRWTRGRA